MFHTLVDLIDSSVLASDGVVGRVVDAYVDDRTWAIRYLVVAVAGPEGNREMVCFPEAVTDIDVEEGCIQVCGLSPRNCAPALPHRNLRSSREVLGCAVSGCRGTIGCTEDAIFEVDSWVLRFLLIDGGGVCKGAVVLLQPTLIDEVRWEQGALHVGDKAMALLLDEDQAAIAAADRSGSRRLH